jgi:hypothetical protein
MRFHCPYLGGDVEWTEERERHVAKRHPELLPAHRDRIAETIADPDEIRKDEDYPNTRLFSRWFGDLMDGKHVMVAVVSAEKPVRRHWIVTAFIARKPAKGDLEWRRP